MLDIEANLTIEVEAVAAFPTTATVIRPSLSFAIGF